MVYTFEDKWPNMYEHISVLQAMSKKEIRNNTNARVPTTSAAASLPPLTMQTHG